MGAVGETPITVPAAGVVKALLVTSAVLAIVELPRVTATTTTRCLTADEAPRGATDADRVCD